MTMKDKLTKKQEAFCQAMIKYNHNQYLSYKEAYPDAGEKTCRTEGARLMKKDIIINRICELEEEAWRQACITPTRIAKEIASIAFAPIDNDNGLTYAVKKDYFNLLQKQLGLQTQRVDAKVDTTIKVDIEDDELESEE